MEGHKFVYRRDYEERDVVEVGRMQDAAKESARGGEEESEDQIRGMRVWARRFA